MPEREEAAWLIERALQEDQVAQDLTSAILFPDGPALQQRSPPLGAHGSPRAEPPGPRPSRRENPLVTGLCVQRQDGVLCGLEVVEMLYRKIEPGAVLRVRKVDGEVVQAGDPVFEVTAPARALLAGERIALNFLGRLSGIATLTARWVKALEGCSAALLDTRKTTPGWRRLEKYAVRTAGASNHRVSLADGILLKDNHAWILRAGGHGCLGDWVTALRQKAPDTFLEIEVDTREEFLEARATQVDAILLDNFSLEDLSWAVLRNRELGEPRPLLEASGGITLERLASVAGTGVDRISAGALTHSAVTLDFSLECRSLREAASEGEDGR